jgi:hypothetical protein
LPSHWDFDAFVVLGMDRMTVEEFEFRAGGLRPGLDEATVARVDAQGSFGADDFNG